MTNDFFRDQRPGSKAARPICQELRAAKPASDRLQSRSEGSYSLESHVGELKPRMVVPKRQLKIAILDDEEHMMTGMLTVLRNWPNVIVLGFVVGSTDPRSIAPRDADVILMDEQMGDFMGCIVANRLRKDGFTGLIASTTTSIDTPALIDHHFQEKCGVGKNAESAKNFVNFMNGILQKIE